MGRVFLAHAFKKSQQQSESKLNYHLADNLMAREPLATNLSPFLLAVRATCHRRGFHAAAAGQPRHATCGA